MVTRFLPSCMTGHRFFELALDQASATGHVLDFAPAFRHVHSPGSVLDGSPDPRRDGWIGFQTMSVFLFFPTTPLSVVGKLRSPFLEGSSTLWSPSFHYRMVGYSVRSDCACTVEVDRIVLCCTVVNLSGVVVTYTLSNNNNKTTAPSVTRHISSQFDPFDQIALLKRVNLGILV